MGRALFYNANGGLTWASYKPQIKPSQCFVRMLASTVHPADRLAMFNKYPHISLIAGNEAVGQIIEMSNCELNDKAVGLKLGQRVIVARSDIGGVWCEEQAFDMDDLYPVPEELDIPAAASMRINPATAYLLLKKYEKQNILLSAANSQVGRALLAMASPGQTIIGLVRSTERLTEMKTKHPNHLFFLQGDPEWIDKCSKFSAPFAILDCVGGELAGTMLKAVPSKSTLCSYGALSGHSVDIGVGQLIFEEKKVEGFWVSEWFRQADSLAKKRLLDRLCELHIDGTLKPPVMKEIKFNSIVDGKELENNLLIRF